MKDGRHIYTPRSLRATTATLLLGAGVDLTKVQELLDDHDGKALRQAAVEESQTTASPRRADGRRSAGFTLTVDADHAAQGRGIVSRPHRVDWKLIHRGFMMHPTSRETLHEIVG
jgi:hypothetical protein